MEGAGNLERHDARCAGLRGGLADGLDGFVRAADADVAGGVLVADRRAVLGADRLDLRALEAEHGGHGAGVRVAGLLHQPAALVDEADAVLEAYGTGRNQRRVFAERVAGDEGRVGADGARLDCGDESGDAVRDERGLRVDSARELVLGALEAEPGEREAKGLVGGLEDGARGRDLLVEVPAHADVLGALTGKEPCLVGGGGQLWDGHGGHKNSEWSRGRRRSRWLRAVARDRLAAGASMAGGGGRRYSAAGSSSSPSTWRPL